VSSLVASRDCVVLFCRLIVVGREGEGQRLVALLIMLVLGQVLEQALGLTQLTHNAVSAVLWHSYSTARWLTLSGLLSQSVVEEVALCRVHTLRSIVESLLLNGQVRKVRLLIELGRVFKVAVCGVSPSVATLDVVIVECQLIHVTFEIQKNVKS